MELDKQFCAAAALVLAINIAGASMSVADGSYQSPYKIEFKTPLTELRQIDSTEPRNDIKLESSIPFEHWYSNRTRRELGSWGPKARQFPAIPDFDKLTIGWKRQRLLSVAEKWIGTVYQHHHIPDWDPPADWPWKEVAFGRNSKGIDCSDFTSWIYNYGLGIKLGTAIGAQAEETSVPGPGGDGSIPVKTIRDDDGYESLIKKLRTGDLLYIKSNAGKVSHVIMWVGEYGKSPDGVPLVIDSTGSGHKDSNGTDIPIGIHLRPFLKNSWYYKSFSHAHRIIHE